ncbi:hypothetical protein [Plantibacter sp. YIM 135249]|uniref:hypothetical protein n=1 Tax=Plantibacter sp. YIM 135249 TaxID=3423918 RepID=UPI003D3263FD
MSDEWGEQVDDDASRVDGADVDDTGASDHDGLLSRVRVIDDQPLEHRAEAYGQLYDELRTQLEGSDSPRFSA